MILKIATIVLILGTVFSSFAADREVVYAYMAEAEPWPETSGTIKVPHREHPFLFLSDGDFSELAERAKDQQLPWARRQFESILRSADAAANSPLVVPNVPGEWSHHYVCQDCGVRLKQKNGSHVCPRCDKAYDGWPYDGVVAAAVHMKNINNALTLGLAYQLTSRSLYADRSREILLAYADRYSNFPIHDYKGTQIQRGARLFAQTLNEAIALIPLSWTYDLIYNAPGTSAQNRSQIENNLLRPMARVIRRNDMGVSNWQAWHNAAIAAAGLVMQDAAMINYSVHGKSGLMYQLENSVLPDGFWYEGTASYHFYALKALEKQALMMKAAGMDVYTDPKFKALYESPLEYTFPDGRFPAGNDSDPISIYHQASHYEVAFSLYQDARFANVARKGKRTSHEAFFFGEKVMPKARRRAGKSRVFPSLGAVMLRQEQSTSPLAVHMDYGPHGGGHGHPDKLGIVLFANGHDAVPDAGRLLYGAPLHDRWYTTTLAHNTVVVDGENQRPAEGALVHKDFDGTIKLATACCDTAYEDVVLTRTVALAPEYLLDVVAGESSTTRTWDLAYHVRGEAKTQLPMTRFELPEQSAGYQVLENIRAADADGEWQTSFSHKRGAMNLRQADTGQAKVILADGFVDKDVTTCPVVLSRKGEKSPVWITLVSPGDTIISGFNAQRAGDGWIVSVSQGPHVDQFEILRGAAKLIRSTRKR